MRLYYKTVLEILQFIISILKNVTLFFMENNHFTAKLEIIGINPFVFVPEEILNKIFEKAGKNKSPIPVKGFIMERSSDKI
ncbi:hypothetical protein LNP04_02555 [Chryseobacterium sp. C-71]|uniref:hypothetical protein n=1 Tax=Chryseobacterium sp. C-71 TaxID=2893882 RepID=UPI001E548005|nr:hypothetical protein [Chryseobacterium sp. C-71]UFH32613.1 hypothetical protein LNP04_02555 [Chryseobacterium sp. C-71]